MGASVNTPIAGPGAAPAGTVAARPAPGGGAGTGTLAALPITKKIAPHQPGAQRWRNRYGEGLVCVRYRVDAGAGRRVVTVELQVDEAPLKPRRPEKTVWVRIARHETDLQALARKHGAKWDWAVRGWTMSAKTARQLHWADRIIAAPHGDR